MTAREAIKSTINSCREVTAGYVNDFTDAELLVRPVPDANHAAWQLGHLLAAEHDMMTALGHKMPELPAGFAESHTKETARADDPAKFAKKDEYLGLMEKLRAATLAALDATPETDFDRPAPEQMRPFAPTVGAVFAIVGTHELMHAGQFAVVRRKLGKPILF